MVNKTIEDLKVQIENQKTKIHLTSEVLDFPVKKKVVSNHDTHNN